MKAIGLIETRGIVGAIEAADIALKTAQVEIISRQKVKAGINTVTFEGDVGAVKAAVEAAAAAVERMGVLMASHVIARPDDSVEPLLSRKVNTVEAEEIKETEVAQQKQKVENENSNLENIEEEIQEINEILKVSKKKNKNKK
ncbi:MAG: BMC domain-containing protein [Fusobacterium sp.]|nr:BMC domain-containing protein [Fusobacterium sp.]